MGIYEIDIEVEGILFQPIPAEIVSFNIIVNDDPTSEKIPSWVKNIFVWYASDQVSEIELLNAIEYLINEGTIKINSVQKQWHEDPYADEAAKIRAEWEKNNGQ